MHAGQLFDQIFHQNSGRRRGSKMITLSHGLPAELAPQPRSGFDRVKPPADEFYHDDKLNMGPALLLIVTLSLLAWAVIIGAVCLIRPLL
jgi:hypothetical protein